MPSRFGGRSGFMLVQVMVAAGITVLCGVASVQTLMFMNNKAFDMRVANSARAVVQRDIDMALGVPWTVSGSPPAILAITPSSSSLGNVYDDVNNADSANAVTNIVMSDSGTALVTGTLYRKVAPQSYSDSTNTTVIVATVTFTVTYKMRNRNYTYAMTTLRSVD
jgi:hypothetical protein